MLLRINAHTPHHLLLPQLFIDGFFMAGLHKKPLYNTISYTPIEPDEKVYIQTLTGSKPPLMIDSEPAYGTGLTITATDTSGVLFRFGALLKNQPTDS
jgi:hypothetical protein